MESRRTRFVLATAACTALVLMTAAIFAQETQAQNTPRYVVDPSWPKMPLPNGWVTGGLGGTCVDGQDHVIIVNRQNITEQDSVAGRQAPPVIEFDSDGNVVRSWGDPKLLGERLHWCHVDKDNNIWIIGSGSGFIQKYTRDGKLLMQIGKSGVYDSSDGTNRGKPLNSANPQFFFPAAIIEDRQNGDLYVADGEAPGGNARIAVFDSTGRFLRQWPLHRAENEKDLVPIPHCLDMSNDGLIYVCDRQAHRIQVFDKMGSFKRNIDVPWKFAPNNNQPGGTDRAAVVLDFSPDPAQRLMFVVNQNLMIVNIVERQSGRVLSEFGYGSGRYPGQFTTPHGIAVDSRGNVYVAEQEGRRIQKFRPASQ
jgi:sugar lactone lactonase YvrE